MARIRSIKPEFWASEQVMECSPIARLLFIGLWNFCDDGGNHVDSDRTIKAEIFPGDDISSQDVRRLLDELSSNGLIAPYSSNGKGFIHVTGWQHQKIDRPSYKHPPFPGDDSPTTRRTIVEDSPPEWRGEEGKVEEGKGSSSLRSDSESAEEADPACDDLLGGGNVSQHPGDRLVSIVLAAYHEILPKCQRVVVQNPKRLKRIREADKLAKQVCRTQGWRYDADAFWRAYFGQCLGDPWLRGEVANPRNASWRQNIDVLLEEDRFAKIMDQALSGMEAAA